MKALKFINKFVKKLFNNIDTKKGIVTITTETHFIVNLEFKFK